MIEGLIDVLSAGLLLTGAGFALLGGIGLVRFPDLYTRLHAGGITDTIAPLLIVAGLILQSGISLLTIKLLLILLFLLFTTPTASHATVRAAISAGIKPQGADDATKERASSNT
ncbi:MAG: monovalent cation/H(+) antiporter subunit G [Gammaproteobacteria bacterium]|nr:monovalent cation/H(+) antiporter subunit G [Gammaproteobacteria bacterium]